MDAYHSTARPMTGQARLVGRTVLPGLPWLLGVAMALVFLCTSSSPAYSATFKGGDNVSIAADEVIHDDLYIAGNNVSIEGTVDGDLYAAGQAVTVTGRVNGEVVAAGQTVTLNGDVADGIKAAGSTVSIAGRVSEDVFAAGNILTLGAGSAVGRDVLLAGSTAQLLGPVARNVRGGVENMIIAGAVGGDADLEVGTLHLQKGAAIDGRLRYTSPERAIKDPSATVGSEDYKKRTPAEKTTAKPASDPTGFVLSFAMIAVIGLILRALFPRAAAASLEQLREKPLPSLGWGFLILVATPVAAILMMVTVIGLPAGLLLFFVGAFALYLSKLVTGGWIGGLIMERLSPDKPQPVVALLVGVLAISILTAVPVIDVLAGFASLLLGLGAMSVAAASAIKSSRASDKAADTTPAITP